MADYSPTLPGPDAEPTQTPDQQTASGQPLGGQGSLLEALQSAEQGSGGGLAGGGGGIPQEAILSLLQGPSFGQRMGQALAGGAAVVKGIPNPANAIIEQQQRQQLGIAEMLQRMHTQEQTQRQQAITTDIAQRRLRLDEQTKQDEIQIKTRTENRLSDQVIMDSLKNNPNPLAQAAWAQRMAERSGQTGGPPLPPEFFTQQIAIPEKAQDNIRGAIEAGLPDAQILTLYPHATPDYLQAERAIMKNPVMRAKLGYKTDEELRDIQYDHVTKKATAWATENGFKIDSPEFRAANAAFRHLSGGRNIYDADPTNTPDMLLIAQARQQGDQDALAKIEKQKRMEAGIQREQQDINNRAAEARQAARETATEARQGKKPLPGTWVDMQTGLLLTPTYEEFTLGGGSKRYRNPSTTEENLLVRLATAVPMARQISVLIDGMLVDNTPDNLVNALKGKGAKALRNSAGWAQLENLLTEQNIELTGALGPGQFRTQLMTYLQTAGVQTRDTREVARIVQDSIETSIENRRRSIVSGGNNAAMRDYRNPLKPKTPTLIPGTTLRDGRVETEDGKFYFQGGTWIAK